MGMSSTEALTPRRPKWPEVIRVLILSAAAVAVMSPYITAQRLGGSDAF
jgi:hypothetical protein